VRGTDESGFASRKLLGSPAALRYRADVTIPTSRFLARTVPVAILVVVGLAALLPGAVSIVGRDGDVQTFGGDFPAFYAAGRIVLDGRAAELYDPAVQREYQSDFDADGEFLYFAYPPVTAIAYAPISALPYTAAFAVQSLAALAALVAAVAIAWPGVAGRAPEAHTVLFVSAVAVVSYPIITSVLGGQNTTFTLLLLAIVWRACSREADLVAGLAAAAMLYKPQYGILVIAVLMLARRWRALAVALMGGVAIYVGSAALFGLRWPTTWLDQVGWFASINQEVNGHLFVNIDGWMRTVAGGSTTVTVVIVAALALVSVLSALRVHRAAMAWWNLGIVAGAMILLAPSALAYDAGLALVAAGVFGAVSDLGGNRFVVAVGVVVASSWLQVLASRLGWSPMFLVLAAVFVAQVVLTGGRTRFVSQATGTIAVPADG
jgi:Glycosyltransferase family 87